MTDTTPLGLIVVRLKVPVKNMPVGTELGYKDVPDAIAALGSAAFFEVVRDQQGNPIPPLTPEEIEEAQRAAQRRAKSRRLILGADFDPLWNRVEGIPSAEELTDMQAAVDAVADVPPRVEAVETQVARGDKTLSLRSSFYAPAADGTTDDRAKLQQLLDDGAGGTVTIARGTYRISGPLAPWANTEVVLQVGTVIEQMTYGKPVFDVYDQDDVTIRGNGATLQYTGDRTHTSLPTFRGSNGISYSSGVWSNGNRTRVYDVRGAGFRSVVFFSGYVTAAGSQQDEAHADNEAHGIVCDGCDFGVLAAGQDRPVIRNVRGTYTLSPSSPDPAHLIYFSASAYSRDLDIQGCTARNGTGGSAFKLQAIRGGRAVDLVADGCEGLANLSALSDMTVRARGLNDMPDAGTDGSLVMYTTPATVERCDIDVEIHAADSTTGYKVARIDGAHNRLRVKAKIRQTTAEANAAAVDVRGTAHTVDLWVTNLEVGGAVPSVGRATVNVISEGHTVTIHEARHMHRGVSVSSGATNCTVNVASARMIPAATTTTTFNIISEPTTILNRDGVQLFTMSGATQVRPDTSLYRTARIVLTDSTAFLLGGLYGTPPQGTRFTVIVDNQSGGAGPTISWHSGIVLAAPWENPASGATKTVELIRDGAVWKEIGRTA